MEKRNTAIDNLCVGIDLGTTNSVVATVNVKPNGDVVSKVVEIPRAVDMYSTLSGTAKLSTAKEPTIPSVVYYREENNFKWIVGNFAKSQYPLRSHLIAKSIKSQMGNSVVEGLSSDIPDKTPAMIASRILQHILKELGKIYKQEIKDVVITVPANFDSAMCKATKDAAELAGIEVKNEDGSDKLILLPEPNAVIWDLINQIKNGEISNHILDLSEKKNVLVFDLGGGTLDITMHEISRRKGMEGALKVQEIATNRYTLLGGDDFDEEIAKNMYKRYLKQFDKYPEVLTKLKREKDIIMPQLRRYAEELKFEVNERHGEEDSFGWYDDEESSFPVGGNMGGIGYSYDDNFTQEEVEAILDVFMAKELSFDDYKNIDCIQSTRNIIYPILDVLKKASDQLQVDQVKVDAVIVNGGMSKFYMITERLKEFFGFEPIVALNPDQSVARGAAIYHYYLHQYEEIKDDMKEIIDEELIEETPKMPIKWGASILNDSLYLGLKNGGIHQLIPTGAKLPYQSEVMTGFRLEPGQNKIAIPIKSRNLDGTYRIIANGNISFHEKYSNGAYVAFVISMEGNKVITMKAWTSNDKNGNDKIEEGSVDITINNKENCNVRTKVLAPIGSELRPKEEIHNLIQLCQNYEKEKNYESKREKAKRIKSCVMNICNAGNKNDFENVVLDALNDNYGSTIQLRLFVIARKIGHNWSEEAKMKLARTCMNQINAELLGITSQGEKVATNIQAIFTLSMCANKIQLNKLETLHDKNTYLQACLYVHGSTKTQISWLLKELEKDIHLKMKGKKSNLQFSAYAIAMALRKDGNKGIDAKREEVIVKKLCKVIKSKQLTEEELVSSILALGHICDQREQTTSLKAGIIKEVRELIQYMEDYYNVLVCMKFSKIRDVALKMIHGERLDEEEVQLTKLEY